MKETQIDTFTMAQSNLFELQTPFYKLQLSTVGGLHAETWENRLTGRRLSVGKGLEVKFDIGLPKKHIRTPTLRVIKRPTEIICSSGEAKFELSDEENSVTVIVTYRVDPNLPVLQKFVTITNNSHAEWNRLLNVRLGTYCTDAQLSGGEEKVYPASFRRRAEAFGGLQGFPVYVENEFFVCLAHPAGWNTQKPGEISLRHFPGKRLAPQGQYECMEVVYGVSPAGGARNAFTTYVRSRMRRTVRGHNIPYAIFEPFGGRLEESFEETEEFVLDMVRKVANGQNNSACKFDLFSLEFWVDYFGNLEKSDPSRFPNDLYRIKEELEKLQVGLGLWIDSSICAWSVGGNPATYASLVQKKYRKGFGRSYFCRATEPIRSMYTQAFIHHIRENGARLLKFDNLTTQCNNSKHEHLPGIYSTEAIINGVIECYRALDAANPDVFIMLYWGYRSPWWLLYGDVMFETGVQMEAASPGHMSAPFIRDGVTRKLDQGHKYAQDVPWLGTDSLGVWLSHWGGWNSGIGPERWQEGFIMDICRGNALAQIWSDPQWLTPAERRQVGEFIRLMKSYPLCFTSSRLILGDPWEYEPYGYCCTDGQRAILAINNSTWEDRVVTLELNSGWGLPDSKTWNLYCWYPKKSRLTNDGNAFNSQISLALRAFEVILLEAVPYDEPSERRQDFAPQPIKTSFNESSQPVEIAIVRHSARNWAFRQLWRILFKSDKHYSAENWTIKGEIPAIARGGFLVVVVELSQAARPVELPNLGRFFKAEGQINGHPVKLIPVLGSRGYPSAWQAWRYEFEANLSEQPFEIQIGCSLWKNTKSHFSSHILFCD